MRVSLSALFILVCEIAGGCAPEQKCNGVLYYDPVQVTCRPCPKNSTFKNSTCECADQYEFVNNRCVLQDGAVLDTPDAGAPASSSCAAYCDFAKVCVGDSMLAQSALLDVVSGLHANDTAACTSSCQRDLGGDGSSDPVVACIEAGRSQAMCAGESTQEALGGAITLLGDCCRTRQDNALCKSICTTLKANTLVASRVDFCM